jgi:hypothetical protein
MVTGAAAHERCYSWPATEAAGPALGRRDDPTAQTACAGWQRVRLRDANLGNQPTVTGRLVDFTIVGQEPCGVPARPGQRRRATPTPERQATWAVSRIGASLLHG